MTDVRSVSTGSAGRDELEALPPGIEPGRCRLEGGALNHQREHLSWRRATGLNRALAGLQPAAHTSAARQIERTAGIEPASKNLADFRLTNRPRSQRRAGTEIRTQLARLGRPASRL